MVVFVGIEAAIRAWRNVAPAPWVAQLARLTILVLVVASAGGLGILLAGGAPHEPLHFLYGILAVGSLPVADQLGAKAGPRRRAIITLLATVVLVVLLARLLQTG